MDDRRLSSARRGRAHQPTPLARLAQTGGATSRCTRRTPSKTRYQTRRTHIIFTVPERCSSPATQARSSPSSAPPRGSGSGITRSESQARPRLRGKRSELASPLPAATRYHVDLDGEPPLEDILCRLEDASRGEFEVTPNHVLFGSPVWGMDPYGEPRLPVPGEPMPKLTGGGAGVIVAIVDTGVPRGHEENEILEKVETWPSEEEPWLYSGPEPVLAGPQGHGSFVAGVVRQAAARATVRSYRALDTDSVTDEWYLGHQLALVLAGGARVINLSLGATTRADQTLMGLSALEAAARQERHRHGPAAPIVVAAAGNLASSRKVYPAADPWTISVGARGRHRGQERAPGTGKFQQLWWVGRRVRPTASTSSAPTKPNRTGRPLIPRK